MTSTRLFNPLNNALSLQPHPSEGHRAGLADAHPSLQVPDPLTAKRSDRTAPRNLRSEEDSLTSSEEASAMPSKSGTGRKPKRYWRSRARRKSERENSKGTKKGSATAPKPTKARKPPVKATKPAAETNATRKAPASKKVQPKSRAVVGKDSKLEKLGLQQAPKPGSKDKAAVHNSGTNGPISISDDDVPLRILSQAAKENAEPNGCANGKGHGVPVEAQEDNGDSSSGESSDGLFVRPYSKPKRNRDRNSGDPSMDVDVTGHVSEHVPDIADDGESCWPEDITINPLRAQVRKPANMQPPPRFYNEEGKNLRRAAVYEYGKGFLPAFIEESDAEDVVNPLELAALQQKARDANGAFRNWVQHGILDDSDLKIDFDFGNGGNNFEHPEALEDLSDTEERPSKRRRMSANPFTAQASSSANQSRKRSPVPPEEASTIRDPLCSSPLIKGKGYSVGELVGVIEAQRKRIAALEEDLETMTRLKDQADDNVMELCNEGEKVMQRVNRLNHAAALVLSKGLRLCKQADGEFSEALVRLGAAVSL